MSKRKIILIQGNSLYNRQRTICGRVETILKNKGFDTVILDRTDYPEEHLFIGHLEELRPDAVFTMDLLGFECRTVGDDISYNGIPCLMAHFLSKAPWEYDILNRRYNFTMFFYCTDPGYQQVIKSHYERIVNIGCLETHSRNILSEKERHDCNIDVYLPCTYIPSDHIMQQINALPDVFQKIANYCINELESHPTLLFETVLTDCLQKIEFACESDELIEIMQALKCIPNYIKMHYLETLINNLIEKQIKVSVSGQGWNQYRPSNKTYFHEMGRNGVSYEKCEEIMQNSKAVINYERINRIPVEELTERIMHDLRDDLTTDERNHPDFASLKGKHYDLEAVISQILQDMEL
ncbi:MAG: hypothetical protein Q4G60_01515 [bacterium]|nr:hypothetical protein [bacterium]